jgi:2-amino-4-hydroxy-6-hydroxymethyldihydropteridine diphosphokinase
VQPKTHTQPPALALVALGANLNSDTDSPAHTLKKSLFRLSQKGVSDIKTSRLFRTPAFPTGSGPDYVNAAAGFRWSDTPEALLSLLHEVEAELGRVRAERWGARVIDLDLVALGDMLCPDAQTQAHWAALPPERAAVELPDRLILPHPRLAERSFVLVPMADIAPDWRHPATGLDIATLLAARPAAERAEITPIPWPGQDAPAPAVQDPCSGLVFRGVRG